MKYLHFFILALLPLFAVGCQAYDDEEIASSDSKKEHTVRFPLEVLSAPHILQSPPPGAPPPPGGPRLSLGSGNALENTIKTVVASGVASSTYDETNKYLEFSSNALNRSYFFAANLVEADRDAVKSSSSPDQLQLGTMNYLTSEGKLKTDTYIPMVAAIDGVKYTDFSSPSGAVATKLTYKDEVKFTRAFSKVELFVKEIHGKTTNVIKIEVLNVPAVFGLGGAIADYDTKSLGYVSFNLPLDYNAKTNDWRAIFYVPEHTVHNPVGGKDPDVRNMTHIVVTYQVDGHTYKARKRISFNGDTAGSSFRLGKEGKLLRNYYFMLSISLDPNNDQEGKPFI